MSYAFWNWSLEAYDRAAVHDSVLRLQDRYGLNVNVCLWCAWLASEGRLAEPLLGEAMEKLTPWCREITQSIRTIRRRLKDFPDSGRLYKSVLACELEAEKAEQDILFGIASQAPAAPATPETALRSLEAYARLAGASVDFAGFVKAVFLTGK